MALLWYLEDILASLVVRFPPLSPIGYKLIVTRCLITELYFEQNGTKPLTTFRSHDRKVSQGAAQEASDFLEHPVSLELTRSSVADTQIQSKPTSGAVLLPGCRREIRALIQLANADLEFPMRRLCAKSVDRREHSHCTQENSGPG